MNNGTTVDRWAGGKNATPFRLRPHEVTSVRLSSDDVRDVPVELTEQAIASNGSVAGMGGRVTKAHTIDTPREPATLYEQNVKPVDDDEYEEERKGRTAVFTVYAYDDDNRAWLGGVSWGYTFILRDGNIIPRLHRLATRAAAGRLHPDEDWARTRWNREYSDTAEQVPPDDDPERKEEDGKQDIQMVDSMEN